ncbi:leukocyte receptor cluster member 1 [Hypomesus transpacificus]|uniref:leukocyte receptor cluster member 1 n=1 Tax=Hypomesus transpacificus TaxID=137520 RepID=UPI001F07CDD3|nr:leukocyte receptor cluster member 1 [Hypomesus transpacificus]
MNILPKKSWHVRNKDNIARVRKDEAQAAEEEREVQRRVERAEQEARTQFLRQKSRASLQQTDGWKDQGEKSDAGREVIEHLNLFPLEDSAEKKGNEDYLKDKKDETERQERAIGLLVSLGPQPGTEVTPWYMKTGQEKEEVKKDVKEKNEKDKGKKQPLSEEEKEKRDKRLKDLLDPLKDMKKALAKQGRKEHKRKERRDRGEKISGGESSIERLRAERLQREAEEKRKAKALLDQKNGGKEKEREKEVEERDRPYNSGFFPELARKRQRRDRDSWRDGLI